MYNFHLSLVQCVATALARVPKTGIWICSRTVGLS